MAYRYETMSLKAIYRLLDEHNHIHPDYNIIKVFAKKAYEVAKVFEEKGMNEEFIVKYLDNQLPCDALCEFGLTASVLHPNNIPIEDRIYSFSHNEWLTSLRLTKLQWTWKHSEKEVLEETQKNKIQKLKKNYEELQELALSYKLIMLEKPLEEQAVILLL